MVGSGVNGLEVRKGLGTTVGGLVWVQRKNGSWWPGQIVGVEELSETDLAVPRSGTPIKLLGRDDTSLDWFDLETTKSVKAFRCGEYETCIEKARVSAANNLLKFTRYPRRENAIVCALEIEKLCKLKCPTEESEHSSEETSSEEMRSAFEEKTNLTQELSHSSISYEETNGRGRKRRTSNDSEDDGYEGSKRMKGLNDLGMNSKKKKETILGLQNSIPESSVFVNNPCGVNGITMGTLTNGNSTSTIKRKRSQVVHIQDLLKREHGRRPVTKVLEKTAMVPVHIICDEFSNPFERSDAVSSYYECEDSNMLRNTELPDEMFLDDDSSDMLIDVPYVDEEMYSSGVPSQNIQVQASYFGHESLQESELAYTDQKMEKSASSKWQSKGKRNARHLSKGEETHTRWKSDDKFDPYMMRHENPTHFSPSSNGLVSGSNGVNPTHFSPSSNGLVSGSNGVVNGFTYHHQSRFSAHSNFDLPDTSPRSHADTLLYEIEVKVEATRSHMQHVPYISLMSKVNGKPITGHPVTVEPVTDGFCDLQSLDDLPSGSCELDDEETEIEAAIVEPRSHKKKKTKPGSHRSHRRKPSRSKKRHGSKTRKLSSLTGAQKLSLVKSKPTSRPSKGPTLACIPLKVVFSRINEALNGSRSAHRTSNT